MCHGAHVIYLKGNRIVQGMGRELEQLPLYTWARGRWLQPSRKGGGPGLSTRENVGGESTQPFFPFQSKRSTSTKVSHPPPTDRHAAPSTAVQVGIFKFVYSVSTEGCGLGAEPSDAAAFSLSKIRPARAPAYTPTLLALSPLNSTKPWPFVGIKNSPEGNRLLKALPINPQCGRRFHKTRNGY